MAFTLKVNEIIHTCNLYSDQNYKDHTQENTTAIEFRWDYSDLKMCERSAHMGEVSAFLNNTKRVKKITHPF